MGYRFSLEAVFAGKGDALLLHHGTTGRPRWTLIDGGHKKVYANYLRPLFDKLRVEHATSLTKDGKLPLDMVMVSHADEDHLMGLLDLKNHIEDAGDQLDMAPVDIRRIWLNGFDDLTFPDLADQGADATRVADEVVASALGVRSSTRLSETSLRDGDLAAVIASTGQARELREFARGRQQIPFNEHFGGELVRRDAQGIDTKEFSRAIPGVAITVLSPDETRIKALRRRWKADLKIILEREAAKITAFDDTSPHNLASIMVMLERKNKTMLLTGDGRGDHLAEGLIAQGFLRDKNDQLHVDLFKIPHHGSSRNVTAKTFETIHADHYVISANGEHDNPDPATLSMLVEGRKNAGLKNEYQVHFTFPDRAFRSISDELAQRSPKRRKQRDALIAVNNWIRDKKPKEFVAVFRDPDELSVKIPLL